MAEVHSSPGTEPQDVAGGPPLIPTAEELIAALSQATAGRTILLENKEYKVDRPLVVPDGVTLEGAGEMLFDGQGLPDKFKQGTATTITAKDNLAGNLLTLGNGSNVKRLVLQGLPGGGSGPAPEDADGRGGNVVAVASRFTSDIVSATIEECELKNRIRSGFGTDGPTGGAVLAYTRNPRKPPPPAPQPHEDATVTVTVSRSIVDTPKNGKAVVAMNFASGGQVTVRLENSVFRGPLDVIGGLSRPDAVRNATTTIDSDRNRYSAQGASDVEAWQIIGGSSSPLGGNANTDSNSAIVQSNDDKIEKFLVGISAVGGRRLPDGGTCSHNTVDLTLNRMKLDTKPQGAAADFMFVGAQSGGLFPAGDGNTVKVDVRDTTGSGLRENLYVDSMSHGTGNQLDFVGTLADFNDSNQNINPAPPAEFF